MTHTDRLYYAFLAEPAAEGTSTPHTPAHLTLVPPFAAAVDVARSALTAALAGWRPFAVHAADPARFGPRHDVPVHLIEPVNDLRRLHEALIAELAARGVELAGDRHVHERFVPHIRIRPAFPDFPRIASGQELTIDHVALVRRADGLVTILSRQALAG